MSLRVALVIDGDQTGAKKALDDTAAGIGKVQEAAGKAAPPVKAVSDGLVQVTAESGKAAPAVTNVGTALDVAGGKMGAFKALALGALGGIAGGLAGAGIAAASELAVGAFRGFVGEVISSAPQVERALTAHADLVDRIKGAYREAGGAASSYGENSRAALVFAAQQNSRQLLEAYQRQQGELLTGGPLAGLPFMGRGIGAELDVTRSAFVGPVTRVRQELREGRADIIAFRNEIREIALALPQDDEQRSIAERLLGQTDSLAEVQVQLQASIDVTRGLAGESAAMATAIGGSAEAITRQQAALVQTTPSLAAYLEIYRQLGQGGSFMSGAAPPRRNLGEFAKGGDTGPGRDDEIAGFVHRNEYVFDAATTARIGVANLDAIRRGLKGYAAGGFVGRASSQTGGGTIDVVGDLTADLAMLSGAVTDLVADLWETRDPLQALGSVIQSVSRSFLDSALGAVTRYADNAIGGLLNSAVTGLFGGPQLQLGYQVGIGHGGAMIGQAPTSRFVPAALFNNAPRHHAGTPSLRTGEAPFIGMEGEEIGWPKDLARKYGGAGTVNYWTIETPNPRAFLESRASLSRAAGRLSGSTWRHS